MSQNRLTLEGLDELRQALRALPEDLSRQAGDIVTAAAAGASQEIRANYAYREGGLQRGVTLTQTQGRVGARAVVRSGSPHASLYEKGTKPRRTSDGKNRGSMPVAPQWRQVIPTAVRARASMTRKLIDLVRAAGFEVRA